MKRTVVLFFSGVLLLPAFLLAQEDVDLARIVVTPHRYEETILKTPAGIDIISSQQIKNSNAQTIPDLLRPETGLVVRDWYGNGSKVAVDMRGFGERSSENTLVLVDGRRVNEIDLSGVNWTQIPVDHVERIEVLRGGSGSVLYGDNASGGVINIVTRTGRGKPRWEIDSHYGSYDFNKQKVSLSGKEDGFSYLASAARQATHGYRENNHLKTGDFNSNILYAFDESTSVRLAHGYHTSEYGLPGELSDAELLTMSRRSSKYGDDFAKEKDYFVDLGGSSDFEGFGKIDVNASFRRRDMNTYFRVFYGGFGNPVYDNTIDTVGITPKYVLQRSIAGRDNKLIAGIDYYSYSYSSDNYDYSDALQSFADINKISTGYYVQDELSLSDSLYLLGGYRHEKVRYEFDYNTILGTDPLDTTITPSQNAVNSGLIYAYSQGSSAFLNLNRSFRFPNTEEYLITWPSHSVDTTLKPQEADQYELGVKHSVNRKVRFDATVFRMKIKEELFYDYSTFTNKNYDKTRRDGIELGLFAQLSDSIDVTGSYTYTKAVFEGGTYDKKTIPLVPRNKASFGLRYCISDDWTMNISGNYVGERFFINDQANVLSRLNGYFTLDTNVSYRRKDLTASLGVNNLLDKKYAEYASCNTGTGKKVYYPSPERNFSVRLSLAF